MRQLLHITLVGEMHYFFKSKDSMLFTAFCLSEESEVRKKEHFYFALDLLLVDPLKALESQQRRLQNAVGKR